MLQSISNSSLFTQLRYVYFQSLFKVKYKTTAILVGWKGFVAISGFDPASEMRVEREDKEVLGGD